jgi:hypothetical protein
MITFVLCLESEFGKEYVKVLFAVLGSVDSIEMSSLFCISK